MIKPRIIPCLLLQGGALVKTIKFKEPKYIGDPINTVKIFNEKCADELILLDISASTKKLPPQLDIIEKIASQCFMPLCYGGGINDEKTVRDIFSAGVEKVSISSYVIEHPQFIKKLSGTFGSQSIVACIDVKKNSMNKHEVFIYNGKKRTTIDPIEHSIKMEEMGAGELLINSIDNDGIGEGYDIDLIKKITDAVSIPVIACGGAGNLGHMHDVIMKAGASAAAAGSLFVFYGRFRSVLINYPSEQEINGLFNMAK